MDKKKLIKIFVLLILTLVVNVNAEGGAKIDDALKMVKEYHECTYKGEWLDQTKLIIQEELDEFKKKLVCIPKFKALEEKTSNELYALVHSMIMKNIIVDNLEIIGFVQESEGLAHVVVRHTITMRDIKHSKAKMLTLKYIDNEWKINAAERLGRLVNRLETQLLKMGTQ